MHVRVQLGIVSHSFRMQRPSFSPVFASLFNDDSINCNQFLRARQTPNLQLHANVAIAPLCKYNGFF